MLSNDSIPSFMTNSLPTHHVLGLGKSGFLTPGSSQSSKKERQGKDNPSVVKKYRCYGGGRSLVSASGVCGNDVRAGIYAG